MMPDSEPDVLRNVRFRGILLTISAVSMGLLGGVERSSAQCGRRLRRLPLSRR